jgi:hypothetical protein
MDMKVLIEIMKKKIQSQQRLVVNGDWSSADHHRKRIIIFLSGKEWQTIIDKKKSS